MKENQFKIVIPVYNSERWIIKCLESLTNQTYFNWNAVIINDNSTDKTLENIKNFLVNLPEDKKKRFKLFDRGVNVGALSNIIHGVNSICKDDEDIIALLDGDDWLASNDVLEYLNVIYQDDNIWLTYGRHQYLSRGYISQVVQITDTRSYRTSQDYNSSHLRTFKYKIWKRIQDVDFRDKSGKYYSMAWDLSIMFPLIEMAGPRRIKAIDKLLYIYNDENPINDFRKSFQLQRLLDVEIRNKLQYKELI